jgi:hypothetical protein
VASLGVDLREHPGNVHSLPPPCERGALALMPRAVQQRQRDVRRHERIARLFKHGVEHRPHRDFFDRSHRKIRRGRTGQSDETATVEH